MTLRLRDGRTVTAEYVVKELTELPLSRREAEQWNRTYWGIRPQVFNTLYDTATGWGDEYAE